MFLIFNVLLLCIVTQYTCHSQFTPVNISDYQLYPSLTTVLPTIESLFLNDSDTNNHTTSQNNTEENIIPICCPTGLIYNLRACVNDTKYLVDDVEIPPIYDDELELTNKTPSFRRHYGVPCENGLYPLNTGWPYYDVFFLLENGTIYYNSTYTWLSTNDYCLAYVVQNDSVNPVVGVCSPPDNSVVIPIEYSIGMVLSAIFLAITFLIYVLLPELKNIHSLTLLCHVASLCVAYVSLAWIQFGGTDVIHAVKLCMTLAFIIHFSFLASFFWLNVMCFDIWWTFGGFRSLQGSFRQRERKKFTIYSIYAWGCAGFLTTVCIIMDLHPGIPETFTRPEFGEESCWFKTKKAMAIYFYGPMAVTIVCNIILFISTAIKILHHKRETAHHLRSVDSRRHDDNKQWFNLYLKLFIVMGINWSMEIISWLFKDKASQYVWYVTDLANTLQGVIIFIIFVWKEKIKRLLVKRFGCTRSRFRSRNSTRSGCNSSTSMRTVTSIATPFQDKATNSVEMNCLSSAPTHEEHD